MNNLSNILLGFQIGFLTTAVYYAWMIMKLPLTHTFAYKIAVSALFLMALWRVDKIFGIFPELLTTFITFVITILWMTFFLRIYTLMRPK